MKIRNGFVSNSSSSSFVVAFPVIPQSVDEVRKLLFGDAVYFSTNEYNEGIRDACWERPIEECEKCSERFTCFTQKKRGYPTLQIATTVWNDLKNQKPNRPIVIGRTIRHGWFEGKPDYFGEEFQTGKTGDRLKDFNSKKYDRRCRVEAGGIKKRFLAEHPDAFIYVFSYADEDGQYGSTLEHGGIFDKLPHIQISYH